MLGCEILFLQIRKETESGQGEPQVNTLVTFQTSLAASQVFHIFQFLNGVTGTLEISKEILKMMSVQ